MADADRDSDLGDDSPVSARSEGDSSGEQSCESSDEGVGRDAPAPHQPMQLPIPHQPQHMTHHGVNHQMINNHQINHTHQRNSPRPLERELKVRDEFESLKTSLHPHLSSLASLAQGPPLSTTSSVFALASGGSGNFHYAPPAFLAPAPPPPAQPVGSASSSSSEGSAAGWSFEEQYKQVRQLYEISDDPQRKEFLDDLFSFMQKRGTPINRLPIMAKSVLDLYELYNLVVARMGLVEVINKKLWQEIIKGLRLPSSITSAAFTLRTQYMKYLYDYECDKKNFSTRQELEAAIEGNKREGRRSSGQYDAQAALAMQPLNRVPVSLAQLSQQIPPLSALSLAGGMPGLPRLPSLPPPSPHLSQPEIDYRVREYMKMMQQHQDLLFKRADSPPNPLTQGRDAAALAAMDMSRFALWSSFYNNNIANPPQDLEPQREALNLSESPGSCSSAGKREASASRSPPAKRRAPSPPSPARSPPASPPRAPEPRPHASGHAHHNGGTTSHSINGASFSVVSRGDVSTGDNKLFVSMDLNGETYVGVLFPQNGKGQNGLRDTHFKDG